MWVLAAVGSAIFAGITSILAKCGIRHTDSDVATAVRTIVVLAFAWLMAGVVGSIPTIGQITPHSLLFLALSGLATGASWICYFKALSMGDVNKVVPIDKCSTVLTVLLAIVLFGETENLAVKLVGCVGILVGTLLMIERKQQDHDVQGNSWMWYAVGSAVFAALTSILAKVGIEGVESNLATAIRTCFVLVMAWVVVAMRHRPPRAALHLSFRRGHGRLVALLLLRHPDGRGLGRGSHRQAVDRGCDGLLRCGLQGDLHQALAHGPGDNRGLDAFDGRL